MMLIIHINMKDFYPIIVINIETDPTLVDVNIHPTKQDIKMSKMEVLTDLLYQNIKKVLYNNLHYSKRYNG